MRFVANLMRQFAKWQFRVRGLSTIADIGDEEFSSILAGLESSGWKIYARYAGIDVGIDYDCIRLKRKGVRLKCEWDNWDEWSIEGPALAIHEIADRFNRTAKSEWRWAVWDQESHPPPAQK